MILQALKEYYDRKPDLPRAGFERKEIQFVLVLNPEGVPVSLNDTSEGEGKARRAKQFLVPQAVKRSANVAANLLWDNPEYVLGLPLKGSAARVAEKHAAFKQRVDELGLVADPGIAAVRSFLSKPDKEKALQVFGSTWEDLRTREANLSFQLAGQPGLVVEQPLVRDAVATALSESADLRSVCLVTGETQSLERLHPPIKGVWGAQSSGANIVSFNLDPFSSFNRRQGANAPVCKAAAFAYTTALNHLLRKESKQRMQVGDSSTVFWSQKPTRWEGQFTDFFGEPPKDDPDRNVRAVSSLFQSVHSGAFSAEGDHTRFYVLGLAPNASRISVRFWIVDTVSGMAGRICQHFEDTRITHGLWEKDTLSLFRLLISTAAQGKSENILPNLGGDMMRAILEGLPYPLNLFQAVIRRIRAEHEISYPRAALIKAYLNRSTRFTNPKQEEELHVSLDPTNTNIGYRLGRLFATLEKIQLRKFTQNGDKEPNSTIRDRYYGSASGTPLAVFGTLIRLSKHHLSAIENVGERINFEKVLAEIVSGITDFPSHLSLDNQGRFAIGYYHQMQEFFTKKNENHPLKGN